MVKTMENEQIEKAWELLRLEDRLYGIGYDQSKVEEIMEYASTKDLNELKQYDSIEKLVRVYEKR